MKIYVPMALAVLIVVSVWGRAVVPAALPPAVHADTETVTNVPFAVALDAAGRLSFDLVCRATPSNNVEVAFGTDANGNGVLEPEETDRVVGWDCGSWFTRKGADGACQMENGEWKIENGVEPGVNKKCKVMIAAHTAIMKFDRRVALRSAMPAAFLYRQCIPASLHRAATSVLQADSIMPDPM